LAGLVFQLGGRSLRGGEHGRVGRHLAGGPVPPVVLGGSVNEGKKIRLTQYASCAG